MTKDDILYLIDNNYNTSDFKFDPIEHKYTLSNDVYISVTQFLQRFHKKFESDFWSKKKSIQKGISQEEMLLEWKEKNDRANVIGTGIHNWIENYFNKIYTPLPVDIDIIDRINKFNIIFSKSLYKLEPVCFETRIFSKKFKIAGMIDSIFMKKDDIYIIDWKSNKVFLTDEDSKGCFEKLLPPFDNYYKNHLNEYSIQISLYRMILKEIGIDVKSGFLVHIGPESSNIYKCIDFVDILQQYLEENGI